MLHLHRRRHIAEDISPRSSRANRDLPSEDSPAQITPTEYDRGLWRHRSFSSADAATPIGASHSARSGDGYLMTNVLVELNARACQLPGLPIFARDGELTCLIALLQTSGHGLRVVGSLVALLFMCGGRLCVVLVRRLLSQRNQGRQNNERKRNKDRLFMFSSSARENCSGPSALIGIPPHATSDANRNAKQHESALAQLPQSRISPSHATKIFRLARKFVTKAKSFNSVSSVYDAEGTGFFAPLPRKNKSDCLSAAACCILLSFT